MYTTVANHQSKHVTTGGSSALEPLEVEKHQFHPFSYKNPGAPSQYRSLRSKLIPCCGVVGARYHMAGCFGGLFRCASKRAIQDNWIMPFRFPWQLRLVNSPPYSLGFKHPNLVVSSCFWEDLGNSLNHHVCWTFGGFSYFEASMFRNETIRNPVSWPLQFVCFCFTACFNESVQLISEYVVPGLLGMTMAGVPREVWTGQLFLNDHWRQPFSMTQWSKSAMPFHFVWDVWVFLWRPCLMAVKIITGGPAFEVTDLPHTWKTEKPLNQTMIAQKL